MSASAAAVTPDPASSAPPMSAAARVINTFIAPSKTFTDLKTHTTGFSWFAPWVVLAIFSLGYIATIQQKIGFEQVFQNNLRMSPSQAQRLEQVSPDQKAQAIERGVKFTEIFSWAYPVLSLLFLMIIAAILMATFNFGAGAEVPFSTSLAVVVFASLPGIFRVVLAMISMFAGSDPEAFNIENPVATNLGYFVDPTKSAVLYRLASAFDVTMFWTLALTAIGFACVSKLKRSTTLTVVFGWYAVFVLIRVGLAAAFG
jgi:Yip1-like protein